MNKDYANSVTQENYIDDEYHFAFHKTNISLINSNFLVILLFVDNTSHHICKYCLVKEGHRFVKPVLY